MESSQPNCQCTPTAGAPAPAVEVLADAWDPDLKSSPLCKEPVPTWPLLLDFQESLLVILCKSFQECPQWISVLELLQGCIGHEPNFIFVMCAHMYLWI